MQKKTGLSAKSGYASSLPANQNSGNKLLAGSTSEYYSDTANRANDCNQTETVELTGKVSPLLDFGKKEREYVIKVIQVACQRTTLLRKSKGHSFDRKLASHDPQPVPGMVDL